MQTLRPAQQRGYADYGWINSYHTFSFGSYYDPQQLGFSNLRVINEDRVAPAKGFDTHSHNDMEIISYVLSGSLQHQDSMGNSSIIVPGDIQRMSAGTGVTHSEYNYSDSEPVHFLQIWLEPNTLGVEPAYQQKHFPLKSRLGKFILVMSPDGREGSLSSHQDALLYSSLLDVNQSVTYNLENSRKAFIQVAKGSISINECIMKAGDGLKIQLQESITIVSNDYSEILLFDLP